MRPLLDTAAAGELLGKKPAWMRFAARTGLLPAVRLGRQLRFRVEDLEAWLQQHRAAPLPPLPQAHEKSAESAIATIGPATDATGADGVKGISPA